MDRPRKRRALTPESLNGHVTKRIHTTLHNAFTDEQHDAIEKAASLFQIHPSDLSAAIGSLRNSKKATATSATEEDLALDTEPQVVDQRISSNADVSFPDPYATYMSNGSDFPDGGQSFSSCDEMFGFDREPSVWSNCFASLLPWDSGFTQFPQRDDAVVEPPGMVHGYPVEKSSVPVYDSNATPGMQSSITNGRDTLSSFFSCDELFGFNHEDLNGSTSQTLSTQPNYPPTVLPDMIYPKRNNTENVPNDIAFSNKTAGYYQSQTIDHVTNRGQLTSPSRKSCNTVFQLTESSIEEYEDRPRRGPFRDVNNRAQTAQTRKDNACVRCRMQRVRCVPDEFDPKGICLTCKKVTFQKIVKIPCLRYKITDMRLFRVGNSWSNRWQSQEMTDVSTWSDNQVRTIEITQDYSPNPLVLRVRRFIPIEGDMLSRSWSHGSIKKTVLLPPYAIESLKDAEKAYKEYINKEGTRFFISTLDHDDKLIWDTYMMATNASNNSMTERERILLKMVLRLWVAVRIICRSERICGKDTLGMPQNMMDSSSPMHGKIPITPVMGAQIDVIMIQSILMPLRGMILDQLQKLVLAHKPQNWFCIYLCTFILLHNSSLVIKQDVSYAKKHGLKTRFAMINIVQELHMGANIVLAYFHYCCKGCYPFSLDWEPEESSSMAELDSDQIKFIKRTAGHVQINAARNRDIIEKGACDDEHYFLAQLYEEEWHPKTLSE